MGAGCEDCGGEPGIEDPGFTVGGCNCKRRCDAGDHLCHLVNSSLSGCQSQQYGASCSDCSVNCT